MAGEIVHRLHAKVGFVLEETPAMMAFVTLSLTVPVFMEIAMRLSAVVVTPAAMVYVCQLRIAAVLGGETAE